MVSNNCFSDRRNRQEEIPVDVSPVDQNSRGSRRQPILNTDCVCHSDGHIVKPGIICKTDLFGAEGTIVSIGHHAVASHRAPKQFDRGILLCRRKLRHAACLRELCYDATFQAVRRLPHPPAEGQPSLLDEVKQLRDGIRTVLRMQ